MSDKLGFARLPEENENDRFARAQFLADHTAKLIDEIQRSAIRRGYKVTPETGGTILFFRAGSMIRYHARIRLEANPNLTQVLAVLTYILKRDDNNALASLVTIMQR